MKKLIIFQILLLILGKYFISSLSFVLPEKFLAPFLPNKICVKEMHFIHGQVMLKDIAIKTNNYQISCQRAIILSYFPELKLKIIQGIFQTSKFKIFNINGILGKRGSTYQVILSGNSIPINNINLICDKINIKNNSLTNLQQPLKNLPPFSLKKLDVHIASKTHFYSYFQEFKSKKILIEKIQLETLSKHNIYTHTLKLNNLTYEKIAVKKLQSSFSCSENFTPLTHINLWANGHYADIKDIFILYQAPQFSKKSTPVQIYLDHKEAKFTLNSNSILEGHIKNSHGYFKASLLKKLIPSYSPPFPLTFNDNIFFSLQGDLKTHFNCCLLTQNVYIQNEHLSYMHGNISVKNLNHILWNLNLKGEKTNPTLSGHYNIATKQGYLLGQGYIKPELTYQFKSYLPDWWYAFFKDFRYYQSYPYADFQILFDLNTNTTVSFGNVDVHNIDYKYQPLETINVTFGNQPGFCQLIINDIKIQQNQLGKFKINWPYDTQNPDIECWQFKGQGHFTIDKWYHLLRTFIGNYDNFNYLKLFSEKSIADIKINGLIAHSDLPKEHLNLHICLPYTKFSDIPIKNLKFNYLWTPQKISLQKIQGYFWNISPIYANVDIKNKFFKFILNGENIYSKKLLQHPIFKPWKDSIPKENFKSYDGILKIQAEGKGDFSKMLKLSGNGSIDFKNNHLSQIHLLGPLSKLFSKRFKWQPNISFNQLVSKFNFTEKTISSDKTELLGPSTRAELQGQLDLQQQTISAKVHFSFLDYHRMNFPIMKHVVQIFQPLSKGFSATISGTFKAPQWSLRFNPFRFVFK